MQKKKRSKEASLSSQISRAGFKPQKPVAKMKVSLSQKCITELGVTKAVALSTLSAISSRKPTSKKMQSTQLSEAAESIWQHLGAGDIDLHYATIGHSFSGRAIIDHDILVSLLINYGFAVEAIFEFINDFNRVSAEDATLPLVIVSAYATAICQDIRSLAAQAQDDDHNP